MRIVNNKILLIVRNKNCEKSISSEEKKILFTFENVFIYACTNSLYKFTLLKHISYKFTSSFLLKLV